MPLWCPRLSVILSQLSLPPHLHIGPSVLLPCQTIYHCSAEDLDTISHIPSSAMSHCLRYIWNATSLGCLDLWSLQRIHPPFLCTAKAQRKSFFSLSWHLYICFYLPYIKASLSHRLGLQTTLVWNCVLITSSASFNLETINVGESDCEKYFKLIYSLFSLRWMSVPEIWLS